MIRVPNGQFRSNFKSDLESAPPLFTSLPPHPPRPPLSPSPSAQVTVTGWVALVCIMSMVVVLVGGAFILFRRLSGADRSHTLYQHVKSGDA